MTDIKCWKKGDVIFKEGDFEMWMYNILEGDVAVYANYGKADEKLLTKLSAQANPIFGEMGILEAMPRSATAVALTDGMAAVIDGDRFGEFFTDKPDRIYSIMTQMSARIRELTEDYVAVCRAASEIVNSQKAGREKTGWFKKHFPKIQADAKKEEV